MTPPGRRSHLDLPAMAMMVLFCAIWGFNQVAVKVAIDGGIPPLLQAGLRSGGAALLLWLWCRARGKPLFQRDGSLRLGLLAGIGFSGEFALLYLGLEHTSASRGVVFLYTAPFVVAAALHWLVPSERLGLAQRLGLGLAFAGILAAFGEGFVRGASGLVGDALVLGAAVMWGGVTVLVRSSELGRLAASKVLFYQLAVSAPVLGLASLLAGEPGLGQPSGLALVSLAFQVVVVAFASYLGWFWLISLYPAARLSAFSFLAPLFGMGFGALILGEALTLALGVAVVLVGAGIWLVNAPKGPPVP